MLLEIFLRLPNCRSAILFGSVCQRWHSVISHPEFVPKFINHHHDHQDRYSPSYNILFRRANTRTLGDIKGYQPFCNLFSEESKFLHKKAASSYLDFMPSPVVLWATSDDLLLVGSGLFGGETYYICNPLTKQWFELPKTRGSPVGYALVCMPNNSNGQLRFSTKAQYEYKVVLVQPAAHPYGDEDSCKFCTISFCSKSGQWSQSFFSYPRPKRVLYCDHLDVVTCKGILYWRENECAFDRIVAVDVLNDRCRIIDFPDDCVRGWQNSVGKVYLGAVRGELRMLHVLEVNVEWFLSKFGNWSIRIGCRLRGFWFISSTSEGKVLKT